MFEKFVAWTRMGHGDRDTATNLECPTVFLECPGCSLFMFHTCPTRHIPDFGMTVPRVANNS